MAEGGNGAGRSESRYTNSLPKTYQVSIFTKPGR